MDHRTERLGLTALQVTTVGLLIVAAYDVLRGGWLSSALGDPASNEGWVTFYATIVQVSLPAAVAGATVPFLIGTFSRQETTRISLDSSSTSWWARASLLAAVLSGGLALVAVAAPPWTADQWSFVGPWPPYLLIESLLLLAVATQVEFQRLDPYRLAPRVARRVSISSTEKFGLVRLDENGAASITRHNLDFATRDPMGPFHELMSIAWTARDRVLVLYLLRCLCQQATKAAGADMIEVGYDGLLARASGTARLHRVRHVRSTADEQVVLLVHVLHYLVRNARTSSVRWGGGDGQRRVFTLCLLELHASLDGSDQFERHRRYCLHALVHLAADTVDLVPQGDQEPLDLVWPLTDRPSATVGGLERQQAAATSEIIGMLYQPEFRERSEAERRAQRGSLVPLIAQADHLRRQASASVPDPWGPIDWDHLLGSSPSPQPGTSAVEGDRDERPKFLQRVLHRIRAW